MQRKNLLSLAAAVSTVFIVSACTPSEPHTAPSSPAAPVLSSANVAEMPQSEIDRANRIAVGSIAHVVGSQNYSFKLDFTMDPGTGSKSVTNSAPGQAAVTWEFPISILATNTTAERVSDFANIQSVRVEAIWPAGSPLCAPENANTGGTGVYPWRTVTGSDDADYCIATLRNLNGSTGPIGVGETSSLKADRNIEITVPEASSQAIIDALSDGPIAWAVSNAGQASICGENAPLWVSAAALGCAPEHSDLTPEQVAELATQGLAKVKNKFSGSQGDASTCPFGVDGSAFSAGMLTESRQSSAWKTFDYSSNSFPNIKGTECFAGGNGLAVLDMAGTETTTLLANDASASWSEIQGPVKMAGGEAYVGADSITPESGKSYEITRFAWRHGDLLIFGKLVGSSPAQTIAWLKMNIEAMLITLIAA